MEDWAANTLYNGYEANSPQIEWFWALVRDLTASDRLALLAFVTGSSAVPAAGFARLPGLGREQKFSIMRLEDSALLPRASTCFNLLKLPAYATREILEQKLLIVLRYGVSGFTFS